MSGHSAERWHLLVTLLMTCLCLQTLGLQLTTATRAAFLIQMTSLFTPVMATVAGEPPSQNVWLACCVALAGCLLIAADKVATDGDNGSSFALGELGSCA